MEEPKADSRAARRKRNRASKAELEKRHRIAEDMLSVGLPPGDVVRQLCDRYKVSDRQAESYLSHVYARWARLAPRDDLTRRDHLIKMAHSTFIGAMKEKEFRGCAAALQVLMRLYGVSSPAASRRDPLAAMPDDRSRFAGDRNYQILCQLRDDLARRGVAGDTSAAAEAAALSLRITELFGMVHGGSLTDEKELEAVAAAKRALVNTHYFGTPAPSVSEGRIDDFAAEQQAKVPSDD